MPATPPPSPPHSPPATATPLTSPQRHQQASRHQERNQRLIGSPEQRRTPAISNNPIMFNGQIYNHLPANLAAQLAALPPIAGPSRPRRSTVIAPQPPPHQVLNAAQLATAYAALPPLYPQRNISVSSKFLSIFK
jgi:hypothetical protein